MLVSIGLVVLGILLLVAGGETMLRGAVGLARHLRLTPAVIGLTVVAFGTSVPELAVSALAAGQGQADIAIANVIGSNIFNITVIVGLCALIRPLPITGNTIKLEYPVLALVTGLCVYLIRDGEVGRTEAAIFLAIYVVFTAYLVSLVRRQVTRSEAETLRAQVEELTTPRPLSIGMCLALVGAGVVLLAAGAQSTVSGAVELARMLGMSERVIGLTIVSAGTGLPEVVASLVSSVRGRSDVAIGNVIGSNLFNILGVLGICALVSPLPVQQAIIDTDAWWMLAITLLLFPVMFTGLRVSRWEGVLLLGIYCTYVGVVLSSV